MKAHQRKARLKRARQHQAYCKARDHQYNRRIQELNSWVAYSKRHAHVERKDREAIAAFENHLERGNKWHQQAFNQLVIFLGMFFGVLLGLWWLAVKSV